MSNSNIIKGGEIIGAFRKQSLDSQVLFRARRTNIPHGECIWVQIEGVEERQLRFYNAYLPPDKHFVDRLSTLENLKNTPRPTWILEELAIKEESKKRVEWMERAGPGQKLRPRHGFVDRVALSPDECIVINLPLGDRKFEAVRRKASSAPNVDGTPVHATG